MYEINMNMKPPSFIEYYIAWLKHNQPVNLDLEETIILVGYLADEVATGKGGGGVRACSCWKR